MADWVVSAPVWLLLAAAAFPASVEAPTCDGASPALLGAVSPAVALVLVDGVWLVTGGVCAAGVCVVSVEEALDVGALLWALAEFIEPASPAVAEEGVAEEALLVSGELEDAIPGFAELDPLPVSHLSETIETLDAAIVWLLAAEPFPVLALPLDPMLLDASEPETWPVTATVCPTCCCNCD